MKIGERALDPALGPWRMASTGTAHEGEVQLGYKLVETAGASGAEGVVLARGLLSERDFKCLLGHAGHVGLASVGAVLNEEDVALFETMDVPALRLVDAEASPHLAVACRTGRPLVLSLARDEILGAERVILACRSAGASDFALLVADPRMMEAWQARWPGVPMGLLDSQLSPEELRASHAAVVETEIRLPVSRVSWRNQS